MGKMIRRRKNKKGFTLAEMMLTVVIIIILMGVAFVGVSRYLRSMGLLERDGVAKELFIAAQNHLTMAQGQGFLNDTVYYGEKEDGSVSDDTGAPVYLISVNSASDLNDDSASGIMLPFGSFEETIRAGGNYVIRYQPKTARVLDVFYCTSTGGRFDSSLTVATVRNLLKDKNYQKAGYRRESFAGEVTSGQNPILGWFGGEDADFLTLNEVKEPGLELINQDILYAKISNPNTAGAVTLQVFVEGVSSGISGYFEYPKAPAGDIYLTLDDITNKDRMISNVLKSGGAAYISTGTTGIEAAYKISDETKPFIPGEDIRVYVKAFIPDAICEIKKSAVKTTNSLFEAIDPLSPDDPTPSAAGNVVENNYTTMYIGSFRHLENLNNQSSGMAGLNTVASETVGTTTLETQFNLTNAVQTKDLIWDRKVPTGTPQEDGFVRNVKQLQTTYLGINEFSGDSKKPHVYTGNVSNYTKDGCYLPICPDYPLAYDGVQYKISDVCIDYDKNAGLIGEMKGGSFSNMKLENFDVKTSGGNAGALAGNLTEGSAVSGAVVPRSTDITNVIAYNSTDYTDAKNITVSGGSGYAGGLIGAIKSTSPGAAYGDIDSCAAALYVSSTGSAGGLIGKITGPMSLKNSYSGGHTLQADYSDNTVAADAATKGLVNVICGTGASGGGLVGTYDAAVLEDCYSTCSVTGGTVGGLIGTCTGGSVTNCYATGLVKGSDQTKEGAFAGSFSGTASGCSYFEIINEREVKGTGEAADDVIGYEYLKSVGGASGSEDKAGITAFDADSVDASGKVTKSAVQKYNDFTTQDGKTGSAKTNADAVPYDSVLGSYYQNKYHLRTVAQLPGSTVATGSYVEKHYGDWPAPEIFVINTAS